MAKRKDKNVDGQGFTLKERFSIYQQAWQAVKAHPELTPRTRKWLNEEHNPFDIEEMVECLNNLVEPHPQNTAGLENAETLPKP